MLLQILPDQVKDHWDEIRDAIYESLPPYSGERTSMMNDILIGILTEKITVWVSYHIQDGVHIINGVMTTTFIVNDFNNTRNLLIYTVYGYDHLTEEVWAEGYMALTKFAKKHGCDNIIGYTENEGVLAICRKFGVRISNLITIPMGG